MESRPELACGLDSRTFREYYYLKEELAAFCRENHLPVSGGKQELTERIACFLETGKVQQPAAQRASGHKRTPSGITRESVIEDGLSARKRTGHFSGKRSGTAFPSMSGFSNG